MRISSRRGLGRLAILAAVAATMLTASAGSAQAATGSCASGYNRIGTDSRAAGNLVVYRKGANEYCAVFNKKADLGTPTSVGVRLMRADGTTATDRGKYSSYAGPVYLKGAHMIALGGYRAKNGCQEVTFGWRAVLSYGLHIPNDELLNCG